MSAASGAGLEDVRRALGRMVSRLPAPHVDGPVRLWIDRAFTVTGSGTVVTGTLQSGRLRVGDELQLNGVDRRIRGLQQAGQAVEQVDAVSRVAVNLRGLVRTDVTRGDALLTPDAWVARDRFDVRLDRDARLPAELMLHAGTAAVAVRVRPLPPRFARISLRTPLPLARGDRAILRDPGTQTILCGVEVVDVDPPALSRRGAARTRVGELENGTGVAARLARLGVLPAGEAAGADLSGVPCVRVGEWLVSPERWQRWQDDLRGLADARARRDPLSPGLAADAVRRELSLPAPAMLARLVSDAGLVVDGTGRITRPGVAPTLGVAEPALVRLEERLRARPFLAPERDELAELGLGTRELAVAQATRRLLGVADGVYLLPTSPALAMRELSLLEQPFTVSQARAALATTRRVAVPLLEHLDTLGWTERVDDRLRRVRR